MRNTLIIPVHNRRDVTLRCLRHLHGIAAFGFLDVIVVDDGSTDGTGAAVGTEFPQVAVLRGDGNLWWAGAISLGSSYAFERGAPGAVWLNDDCLPDAGALEQLLAAMAEAPSGIAGATCVDARTGARVATGFVGRRRILAGPGERRQVDGLSGYCIGISAAAWRRAGALDVRRFPHYSADTAYTLRAHRLGCRVELLGDSCVRIVDYRPEPESPAVLRDPRRSWREDYRAVFLSNKSPLRLGTQWHLLRLKYGVLAGTAVAMLRFIVWHARFTVGR